MKRVEPIKVVVTGASGKMAREVLAALCRDPEVEPAGAVSRKAAEEYLSLPGGAGLIPLSSDLEAIIQRCKPEVLVDFTGAQVAMDHVRTAFRHKVSPVVGTSGLSEGDLAEVHGLSRETGVGAVVASNFALGAVLLMHLAGIVVRYFDHVEIVELHHDEKADAPSGTALATARKMAEARGRPFIEPTVQKQSLPGTRGGSYQGIAVHSVRLPGLVAHQEIIFGGLGQTLTLRHDSVSRESFMPGVLLAIKEVVRKPRFYLGLEELLGL